MSADPVEPSIFVEPDVFPGAEEETTFGETPPESVGTPGEKAPLRHIKRASTADFLTLLWGGVGTALIHTGFDVPVGRVLQLEAPLAGSKIDAIIAHTWIDQLLQPLVKQADKIEGLGAIIAFPIMVGIYERNPATGAVIEPILRQVIRQTLLDMAPLLRKRKAEERRAAGTIDDLSEAFDLPKGVDPIDAVLQTIFAGGTEPDEPATE